MYRGSVKLDISREVLIAPVKCNALIVQYECRENCHDVAHCENEMEHQELTLVGEKVETALEKTAEISYEKMLHDHM